MMLPDGAKARSDFSILLRFLRQRIDPDVSDLGPHARLPTRLGKRVTQEEIAEATGVSREWYALLESAEPTRTSTALLDRLADALMVTPEERARLFQSAVPELAKSLEQRHSSILQCVTAMRSSAKRLWCASTVEEALEIAAEEVSRYFADANLVFWVQRVGEGRWKHLFVADSGLGTRTADLYAELASSLTCAAVDEIALYPLLSEPGDIGSRETYMETSVRTVYEEGLVKHKLTRWSFIHARIRSRRGIIGGITVKHACRRNYSDTDRAAISAVASVASLALS